MQIRSELYHVVQEVENWMVQHIKICGLVKCIEEHLCNKKRVSAEHIDQGGMIHIAKWSISKMRLSYREHSYHYTSH